MSVKMDKIGTTFYGDDEIKISQEFRRILKQQGFSINDALKRIIKTYVEDFSPSPTTK